MKKLLSLLVILLATGTVDLFSMEYGAEGALSREQQEAMERERLRLEQEEEHRRFLEIERQRQQEYEAARRQARGARQMNPNVGRRLDFDID
jgi:hypothetical protein